MVKKLRDIRIGDRLPFGREVFDKITVPDVDEKGDRIERITVVFPDGSEFHGLSETTLTVFPLNPHEPL